MQQSILSRFVILPFDRALATYLVPHTTYDCAANFATLAWLKGFPFKDYIAREQPHLVVILEQATT